MTNEHEPTVPLRTSAARRLGRSAGAALLARALALWAIGCTGSPPSPGSPPPPPPPEASRSVEPPPRRLRASADTCLDEPVEAPPPPVVVPIARTATPAPTLAPGAPCEVGALP